MLKVPLVLLWRRGLQSREEKTGVGVTPAERPGVFLEPERMGCGLGLLLRLLRNM